MSNVENISLESAAKMLAGLSYRDWVKLKAAIDEVFVQKRSELERELKLTPDDDVQKVIHARFG